MILSTLDKAAVKKDLIRYIVATAFCIVFSVIYEHFSHGVYSQFMLLMYLFPLIGGVLPAALHLLIPAFRCGDQMNRSIWSCAIMTLTFGSAITGVFEIYGGTASSLTGVYWIAGKSLAAFAVVRYLLQMKKMHAEKIRK